MPYAKAVLAVPRSGVIGYDLGSRPWPGTLDVSLNGVLLTSQRDYVARGSLLIMFASQVAGDVVCANWLEA